MRRLPALVQRSIAAKLMLTLIGFVGLASIAAGFYLNRALEAFAVESLEARLVTAERLLHDEVRALVLTETRPDALHAFVSRAADATEARVSVIAMDGRVIGESGLSLSDLERMENHANRPEVRAARAGQIGRDVRTSATLDRPLLYVAVPVLDHGRPVAVLRLALPLAVVTASYAVVHRVMLVGGLVALLVAAAIGILVARRVTKPVVEMEEIARRMSEGAFDARAPVRSVDEIGALGRALNVLAGRLRAKIDDLEHEQAKLTATLDGMIEGVIAVDGHDHILFMNERARSMFRLGGAAGDGKPFLEVIRNVELHRAFRDARDAASAVLGHELTLPGPSPRMLQVNAVPFPLSEAERGIVIVLHDVTELRRLERVRTEFVANVSHELRTPLTAIVGYVETLLGGALAEPEQAQRFLEIVARHGERLQRLVNDLTDLSNIELGKIALAREPIALDELIDSVLAIIRPRAESKQLTLVTEVADGLAVLADRDRLAQILINLVDNAVKYTPDGGRVTVAARPLEGATVGIVVTDTGIGIPPDDLSRVTERFYRVDKARSRDFGGTGLGLAIVKHLLVAHGSDLQIESQVGTGTTVRFTLPAAG